MKEGRPLGEKEGKKYTGRKEGRKGIHGWKAWKEEEGMEWKEEGERDRDREGGRKGGKTLLSSKTLPS
jgi:hypothetical protein